MGVGGSGVGGEGIGTGECDVSGVRGGGGAENLNPDGDGVAARTDRDGTGRVGCNIGGVGGPDKGKVGVGGVDTGGGMRGW